MGSYPKLKEATSVIFAVLFLLARCIYWPFVTVDFWVSTLASTAPLGLQIIWYVANVGLTLLQYYWGYLIVKGIIKKLKGGDNAPASAHGVGESLQPTAEA